MKNYGKFSCRTGPSRRIDGKLGLLRLDERKLYVRSLAKKAVAFLGNSFHSSDCLGLADPRLECSQGRCGRTAGYCAEAEPNRSNTIAEKIIDSERI